MVLSGLTIIVLPFVRDVPLLVVSILAGIGIGTVWTNTDTLISGLAREGRLGATMGVAGSFKEFGDMAGPLLIGVLAQAFGLTTAFIACGVLGLSSLAVTPRGVWVKP